MSEIFYRIGIGIYSLGIRLTALLGSKKAQSWLNGRKDLFHEIQIAFMNNQAPVLWVHCASLGEFEQGRPVIEKFKKEKPTYKVLLTFFSPSGYEIQKKYAQADWVFYLPLDSPTHAEKFLKITQPSMAVFVKYEFWYFYLSQLQKAKIPCYLISAIFRPQQIFFKWYGGIFRKMLFCFKHIFVQDAVSSKLLQSVYYESITIAGDTRLDRVLHIKSQAKKFPIIQLFCEHQQVIVCGSTWGEDEQILADFLKQNSSYKLIIAPHQIEEKHLLEIEKKFAFTTILRYSKSNENSPLGTTQVLMMDNIGMLSALYGYGQIAYIGGGFGAGIHNTLEAVVYEIPVLFGSNYQKFKEAKDLLQQGVAFEIKNAKDIENAILTIQENSEKIKNQAVVYLTKNQGATEKIFNEIGKGIC